LVSEPAGAGAVLESTILEVWSTEPGHGEGGDALQLALSLVSNLDAESRDDPAEPLRSSLGILISALRAERAFLFEMPRGADGSEPSLGPSIASRDLDGEPVNQPERKVPHEVLARAARTGLPAAAPLAEGSSPGDERGDGALHGLALPLLGGGSLRGVLFIENRFQPLEVSQAGMRLAQAGARVMAAVLELQSLRNENGSLWVDISRLRERRQDASSQGSEEDAAAERAPAQRPRESGKRARRSELRGDYSAIIGSSPRMLEIFQLLDRISGSNAPILINGESGTGKELVAHAIHESSLRKGKVFVSENCGALTETLLESELFGYEKGAFTGANKDHKGLFELAVGGTLFLDEVGDMSPSMQKKLLRVLQEGIIRRVGGKDYIPVDVRIISATNKDLLEEVKSGNFREDLYYRLNVINLKLPPLRERREDIPELVEHFLADVGKESGVAKKIDPAALQRLARYNWPGNIRELRNEIKRLHALTDGDIRVQDLSETILSDEVEEFPFHDFERQISQLTLREATERLEKEMIRNALIQSKGNKSLVAKMLQVPKTSLYNKINKYGFDKL
jgi:two-component system, NtrC family, response regulator HupR/HoxA